MYGDFSGERGPPSHVITVLLIGFDGRRKLLTGTHEELWREYMHGDGGPCCNGLQPAGWEYWCAQPLLTRPSEALASAPIETLVEKKGA
jgi:hypothetical protein